MKINLNEQVRVTVKEDGIHRIVERYNNSLPKEWHTCYQNEKKELDENNQKVFQLYDLIDTFGGLGRKLPDNIGMNIELISHTIEEQ